MPQRVGFACKWIDRPDQVKGIGPRDECKKYNTGATTVAWLGRQARDCAVEKLWQLVRQNIGSTLLLVERVSKFESGLKMLRISSDILPMYTEPNWSWFYQDPTVIRYLEQEFKKVGDLAREQDVRLSMHPGQFTVLASENPDIVRRSIDEFEYHTNMARWMGYGQKFQDFKINVHISGRAGPNGIRGAYQKLSPEARNCITIENEEISWGLDDCLLISDLVPIVLDLHHHLIHDHEYISETDPRISRVIDSWRGVRPVIHYSQSREDLLKSHPCDQMIDVGSLIGQGYRRQHLRAHSDFMWNQAVNSWAINHWQWADVMVEAKAKNLASQKLYREWTGCA